MISKQAHQPCPTKLLDELEDACGGHSLAIIRGPVGDGRLIYLKPDGSAWGEGTGAACMDELSEEDVLIALAPGGLEFADTQDQDVLDEARFWNAVPGLCEWISGSGPHPFTIAGDLASRLRRGNAAVSREHRRIRLNGCDATVGSDLYRQLSTDPKALDNALSDPTRFAEHAHKHLAFLWHETTFEQPISFWNSELESIAAREIVLAKCLPSGGWVFEHPERADWLCRLPSGERKTANQLFHHNGLDIHEFDSFSAERLNPIRN